MSTYVRHSPDGRLLDLAELNSADYRLISGLRGEIRYGDRILLCMSAPDDRAELHVQQIDGKYRAVHFDRSTHGSHEIAKESDEHRRQKHYWWRAAHDAGYHASRELPTGVGTVLDVAIPGARRTGVDIPSQLPRGKELHYARRTFRAGWLPVWFSDSDRTPSWFHRVPSVGCNRISWGDDPPRRAATATGLRTIKARKCVVGAFERCPDGHRRPCGERHPHPEPWRGLTVDEVAAMVPAEEAVPLLMSNGYVYIVSQASTTLYHELTGFSGEYTPDPAGRAKAGRPLFPGVRADPIPNGPAEQPARCLRCGQRLLLIRPGREFCQLCRPVPMTSDCPY